MIGCDCATCRSTDPRDKRWRASVYIETDDGLALLVDAGPDIRAQSLAFNIRRVDAIIFTHGHADHIMGLDDVRRFNVLQQRAMPCFADEATIRDLRKTFFYVFDPATPRGGGLPQLELFRVAGSFCVGQQEIVPVPIFHGHR
ncbi:MAG: MBL fold metallo-hydrolase, partial [Acidobacteria bacterium]|nr:MBL fold metallo-hydrolase [Acidobacteriota bacterium]